MKSSDVMDRLLERPAMYVGVASVHRLLIFIEGFKYAEQEAGGDPRDELYDGFQTWVAERFQIESMQDWASIISFMSPSEAGAFELARTLWAEYKSARADAPGGPH